MKPSKHLAKGHPHRFDYTAQEVAETFVNGNITDAISITKTRSNPAGFAMHVHEILRGQFEGKQHLSYMHYVRRG